MGEAGVEQYGQTVEEMQVPSNFSAVVAPMAACSAGKRLVKLRLRDDEVRQTNYQSQPSAVSYCTELRLHTPVSWSWSRGTSRSLLGGLGLEKWYFLVLVVDEQGSFSAIDAHIFPCLVQTVLEDVD